MSGHTPGPWSLPHFAEPEASCSCGYVLTEGMFGAVCTVHASGESDDIFAHGDNPKFAEAVANAKLIAAAPEMLEALNLARQDLIEWCDQYGGEPPETQAALAVIRAAIAKATQP